MYNQPANLRNETKPSNIEPSSFEQQQQQQPRSLPPLRKKQLEERNRAPKAGNRSFQPDYSTDVSYEPTPIEYEDTPVSRMNEHSRQRQPKLLSNVKTKKSFFHLLN